LGFDAFESPVALQLGGSDPAQLAECAKIAEQMGYAEVNLNVGCPSSRVKAGCFGAVLMKNPVLVAECVAAMKSVTTLPVTVKTRIGVDDLDSYQYLSAFIAKLMDVKVDSLILHCRKAWLEGLSPKENRSIPPLRYEVAYQLKQDFPTLEIILNGGVTTKEGVLEHLQTVDGVMLGRVSVDNPYLYAELDQQLNPETILKSRSQIFKEYLKYVEEMHAKGFPLHSLLRHCLGLFQNRPGGRQWRRAISEKRELLELSDLANQLDQSMKIIRAS
jgi:tRNA-dihydrouridine synthase A